MARVAVLASADVDRSMLSAVLDPDDELIVLARSKRTIARLPKETRSELGAQAARGRQRGGRAGQAVEDRNRQQLYELAEPRNIRGRSKMRKWDVVRPPHGFLSDGHRRPTG